MGFILHPLSLALCHAHFYSSAELHIPVYIWSFIQCILRTNSAFSFLTFFFLLGPGERVAFNSISPSFLFYSMGGIVNAIIMSFCKIVVGSVLICLCLMQHISKSVSIAYCFSQLSACYAEISVAGKSLHYSFLALSAGYFVKLCPLFRFLQFL